MSETSKRTHKAAVRAGQAKRSKAGASAKTGRAETSRAETSRAKAGPAKAGRAKSRTAPGKASVGTNAKAAAGTTRKARTTRKAAGRKAAPAATKKPVPPRTAPAKTAETTKAKPAKPKTAGPSKAAAAAKKPAPKTKAAKSATEKATRSAPAKCPDAVPGKAQPPVAAAPTLGANSLTPPVSSDIIVPAHDDHPTPAPQAAESHPGPLRGPTTAGQPESDSEIHHKTGLLATNAVHATRRRLKRSWHQNKAVLAVGAAILIGVLILADQSAPPDVMPLERVSAARTASAPFSASLAHGGPGMISDPIRATELGLATPVTPPEAPSEPLARDDLVEMERMLARLDLEPSRADGVIDLETKSAIRLYQQIAGLPIDGRPSSALLADMREVVRIMDSND